MFEFTFNATYFHRVINVWCMCSCVVYQTLNIIFSVVVQVRKVIGNYVLKPLLEVDVYENVAKDKFRLHLYDWN